MTGYLTDASGAVWQLPELLEWEFLRTDGSSCDSARVVFRPEPDRIATLRTCLRLRLEENKTTVFYGVMDEFTADWNLGGGRVEISARGMMAMLMDSQLRAATYYTFQENDAITKLVKPFGVGNVEKGSLGAVSNFSWETGASAWTVLCGYCRHAGGVQPRFAADGTLILKKKTGTTWDLSDNSGITSAELRVRRYGIIAKQIVVDAGGWQTTTENKTFQNLGGATQKVAMKTGDTLKCTWRTGQQRIDDSMDGAVILQVTLPGDYPAEPGDTVNVQLKKMLQPEKFVLRSMRKVCGLGGRQTELELEGGLARVAI